VSTAKNQGVGVAKAVSKGLVQINAGDLFGYGVFDPSFFN
jgi:hypothetical protein